MGKILQQGITGDIDLDLLAEEIDEKKCLLILGPEFITVDDKETLNDSIRDYLAANKTPDQKYYLNEDGFFYCTETDERNSILTSLKKFYEGLELTTSYRQLARIPFHLVLSLSPDRLLEKACIEINKKYEFAYFKAGKPAEPCLKPGKDNPLIYNLLGSSQNRDSLVFTHQDLFEFIFSVALPDALPGNLLLSLQEISTFIFLGFRYDKWYLKLIFFLLGKLTEENKPKPARKAIFNFDETQHSEVLNFYHQQFNIRFSRSNDSSFINDLYNKYEAMGKLSSIRHKSQNFKDTIIEMLQKDQIDDAIHKIIAEYPAWQDEMEGISIQFNTNENEKASIMPDRYAERKQVIVDAIRKAAKKIAEQHG